MAQHGLGHADDPARRRSLRVRDSPGNSDAVWPSADAHQREIKQGAGFIETCLRRTTAVPARKVRRCGQGPEGRRCAVESGRFPPARSDQKSCRAMLHVVQWIVSWQRNFIADEPVDALPRIRLRYGSGRQQLIKLFRARSAGQAVATRRCWRLFWASRCSAAVVASAAVRRDLDYVAVVVCGHRLPEFSPASAVAFRQIVGFLRTFAARVVDLQPLAAGVLPGIEERLHRPPAGLDVVGALEQEASPVMQS